jgi:NADPH-dependent curcumin reductase CurA
MARLWKAGEIHVRQTIYEGLESAPEALAACLTGQSAGGKILVRVSPDTSLG